jgi:hypothetical protein
MKTAKLYPFALAAALVLNLLFFGVIAWSFYNYRVHQKHLAQPQPVTSVHVQVLTSPTLNTNSASYAVAHTFAGKAQILRTFKAPGKLQGLVLTLKQAPHQQFIAYFEPGSKLLLLGQVINHHGINTTIAASQKYLEAPQSVAIEKQLRALPAVLTGVTKPTHRITVIVDPNAPLFRNLYDNYAEDAQDGLQVRWVLVNYLKPMGPNLAAWVLQSPQPSKRLALIASKPLAHWQTLQIPPLSQAIKQQLRNNWNLMQENHLVPGPITAFKTSKHVYILHGLVDPESFESLLPSITI